MADPLQELTKALELLGHQMDEPVVANKAARNVYRMVNVFEDEDQSADREAAIHPSALASCLRKAAMEFENIPRLNTNIPPNVTRAARVGKILHGMIQRSFARTAKRSGIFKYRAEVRLTRDMPDVERLCLAGSGDSVLEYGNWRIGHEIKSLNESDFANISKPRESDLLQASVYQHCLQLDAMWFIFISRRSYEERHDVVKIPNTYWDAMRRRATTVLSHKMAGNMPPGTDDSYSCGACSYAPACPHPRNKPVPLTEVLKCVERAKTDRPGA